MVCEKEILLLGLTLLTLQVAQTFAPPAFAPSSVMVQSSRGSTMPMGRARGEVPRRIIVGCSRYARQPRACALSVLRCVGDDAAGGEGSVGGDPSSDTATRGAAKVPIQAAAPGLAALIAFAIPAVGMRITGPILSLIDTSIVGAFGNPNLLAAMTPGTIAVDSSAYMFMFLGIATTNMVANSEADKDSKGSALLLANALSCGAICGVVLALAIHFFSPGFLAAFTGTTSGEVLAAAQKTPAGMLVMVLQSASFGFKDSGTPLKAMLLSASVNVLAALALALLFGDPVLGVALATALAQWLSAAYLLGAMRSRLAPLLAATANKRAALRRAFVPERAVVRSFLTFAGPAFFAMAGKVVCYAMMSFAAAGAGTIALAAHQIGMQVFFLFSNAGDAISNTVQAFLPATLPPRLRPDVDAFPPEARERRRGDLDATRELILSAVKVAGLGGALNGLLAASISVVFGRAFTSSLEVLAEMQRVVPLMFASLLMHASVMVFEGCLFASRITQYLAWSYLASTVVFTVGMFAARSAGASLVAVWCTLFAYQVVRFVQFGWRVAQIAPLFAGPEGQNAPKPAA